MKILVLGCNGMAGHVISLYLHENGHNVMGFARKKSKLVKSIIGDVTDFEFLRKTIQLEEYDVIINCVGVLNQFAENNPANAVLINSYLPHFLAQTTRDMDTYIIQMSTDCVFSGKSGKYTEDSMQDGELFYDRTKALGELNDEKNLTLRNSIVGPDIKESGIGLLNWFMQQKETVQGFCKAIWTGQTTLQLAKTMEAAIKQKAVGLYNMVPNESINKFDLLRLFNEHIRKEPINIIPQETFVADKSLVRTRFEGFDYQVPNYECMIRELGEWMREHKTLYPHYEL